MAQIAVPPFAIGVAAFAGLMRDTGIVTQALDVTGTLESSGVQMSLNPSERHLPVVSDGSSPHALIQSRLMCVSLPEGDPRGALEAAAVGYVTELTSGELHALLSVARSATTDPATLIVLDRCLSVFRVESERLTTLQQLFGGAESCSPSSPVELAFALDKLLPHRWSEVRPADKREIKELIVRNRAFIQDALDTLERAHNRFTQPLPDEVPSLRRKLMELSHE